MREDNGRTFRHSAFAGLVGVAREDITPPDGIYARNWGAALHDAAEGVHRPLTVTALSLQAHRHDPPLVLIAADLGWWRAPDDERTLLDGLREALSLDPARLMVALSHTHAGPSLCRDDAEQPGGAHIAPYLESVQAAMARAARRALATARPSAMEWTAGRCGLARNRDLPDPDRPRVVCGYHPAAPADDTLLVGRITGEGGAVVATLVNYACHPTTLAWKNHRISPDYVGALRETVEAQTGGAPCLFLQGASGELAPREQYTADTDIADAHGREVGFAVLSALAGMLPPRMRLRYEGVVESGAPLAVWGRAPHFPPTTLLAVHETVELPLKPSPPLAEIGRQALGCEDRARAERLRRAQRIRKAVGDGPATNAPVWAWRVGDTALIGQPNEAYSDLQTALRARFPERAVVVMNVVNGPYAGYLPSEDRYGQDAYQVWQTPFAAGGLERLTEACARAVERLFEARATGEEQA